MSSDKMTLLELLLDDYESDFAHDFPNVVIHDYERERRAAAKEIMRLRAEIERLQNECYKKCGVCEFDYGRAAPREAESGWQPISTAPKTDNNVLVSNGEYVWVAFWNKRVNCWTVFDCDDEHYSFHLNEKPPTHWQPLLKPPVARSGDSG